MAKVTSRLDPSDCKRRSPESYVGRAVNDSRHPHCRPASVLSTLARTFWTGHSLSFELEPLAQLFILFLFFRRAHLSTYTPNVLVLNGHKLAASSVASVIFIAPAWIKKEEPREPGERESLFASLYLFTLSILFSCSTALSYVQRAGLLSFCLARRGLVTLASLRL